MGFNLKQLFSLLTSPGWRTEEYTDSELEEMMNAGDQEAAQQETQNTAAQAETPGGAGIDWESYQNNGLNDSAPTVRQTEDSGWVADPGLGLNDYEKLKESFASQAYAELVQKQKGAGQAASGNQPTLGERINYGLKSIGQSWGAAAPMLADTYKQGSQDAKAFQDELIAKGANRWDVWEAYENKDKEWIEQEAARFGVKLNQTVLTPETSKGMQKQAQAAQNSAKALEGSSGFPRDAGEALLSVGQNAVVYPTAFINPAIPVALMGARAAAQREYELASQGVGAGDTQRRGIVSGLIETGTEAISLGSWVKILKAAPLDSITKVIAKQSGTEMTEEGLSYFLNLLSDMAEKDPNAKFSWNDLWHQVKIAGLSGGVMGGTGIEINRAANFLLKGGANTQFNSPESVAKAQGAAFDETSPGTAAEDVRQTSEQPMDGQTYDFTDADVYKRQLEKDAANSVAENGDVEYTGNQQEAGSAKGAGDAGNASIIEKITLLDDFTKSNRIKSLPLNSEEILAFTDGNLDIAKNVVEATKEVIPGKTVPELVDIFKLPNDPASSSLSTYQTRIWYKWQESLIGDRLNFSKPLEQVARDAFDMRNEIRTKARISMSDGKLADLLMRKEKNLTFEELVKRNKDKGFDETELWNKIIRSSMSSRDNVNKLFQIE